MDNLRSVIELLFTRRKLDELYGSLNSVNGIRRDSGVVIDKETFKSLFLSKELRYSENQLDSVFDITNDTWSQNKVLDYEHGSRSVFNVLTHLTSQMLVSVNGMPYCRYEEYLRWNEASKDIGEDILVTNFLAASDFKNGITRTDFAWHPYILTSNRDLKYLMSKGLAELHNHMKGSSHIFTLNWLAVMNCPRTFGNKQYQKLKNYDGDYREISLAAFIRSILYKYINNIEDASIEKTLKDWIQETDKLNFISLRMSDIQSFIDRLKFMNPVNKIDYAVPNNLPIKTHNIDSRISLIGERKLLYQCFEKVNSGTNCIFETLLYIYLIIKAHFRYAMVQVNDVIGFANFSYYDKKKADLLKALKQSPVYRKELVKLGMQLAVQDTFVKHIEYRITPEMSATELRAEIKKIEEHKPENCTYGYIIHFIKEEDKAKFYKDSAENGLRCRNHKARERYKAEANSVKQLLESGEKRIVGIDAANSEFFCRPEVFGPIFRKLRHVNRNPEMDYLQALPPYKLGFTFHAGEDFYDIIDGLRAMEEAITFLNLRNGDRIGHGTALGINVLHYYEEKHFTVVMPKQVKLDNIVWLLDKIEKYGIDGGTFLHEAKKDFYRLREEIYHNQAEVQTFMNAWLLRGDEPSLYLNPDNEPKRETLIDIYQLNMDNKVVPARTDKEARKLYYRYHYDTKVKSEGSKSVEWKIDACHRASFVRILETIQEKMQEEIARWHIAIECNPTSNLRIGNIPRYVEHPIVKFNNEDLIRTDGKVDKSAQISVSINTDDAGIFATSLEKEFTLMALALEKETTKDGEPKYQQRSVYRWLENIRENAFIQKFGEETPTSVISSDSEKSQSRTSF